MSLVMVALPAVLLLLKFRAPLLVMVALPAVLFKLKFRVPLLVMVALPAVLLPLKVAAGKPLKCWRSWRYLPCWCC